jgi:uncharacterized SAM-binding protein YcdF (DUF218 family)
VTESKPAIGRWLIFGGVFIVLAGAALAMFFAIGQWLVVQDPLAHADVIVILSGRLPERAVEAARLFQAGYAGQVWISAPSSPEQALKAMNISFLGEDFYNEKVLLARGVPADSIRVMARPSANTEEEVRQIADNLLSMNYHSAMIVTSKSHTRRVRLIWHRLVGSEPRLILRYATDDSYDGAHWWRHTRDALDVIRETLGLCNAWAGFPLRPRED